VPAPQGDPVDTLISQSVLIKKQSARTSVYLGQISQLTESGGVSERDVKDAMMSKRAEGCDSCRFLSSTKTSGRDEYTCILARKGAFLPESSGGVPECLPGGFISADVGDGDGSHTFH
jgi:hypothetical protein